MEEIKTHTTAFNTERMNINQHALKHVRAHEKSKCTHLRKHERGEVQNDVVRSVYLISVLSAV